MERYDAAIIGAGPDGLVAAHRLAKAGLRTIVLERAPATGGRAATRAFHPGFRASPFMDALPPLPDGLFREIDPPRHGAVLKPAPASVCVAGKITSVLFEDEARLVRAHRDAAASVIALRRALALAQRGIAERALVVDRASRGGLWRHHKPTPVWPGHEWAEASLADALTARIPDADLRLHLAAAASFRRPVSPYLAGTALHLLTLGSGGTAPGGLGTLAGALDRAARAAGAFLRCDSDVAEIRVRDRKAHTLQLRTGEEISADAVVSTLDLKRTFLDLLPAKQSPDAVVKEVARFRSGAAVARVLFALDRVPRFSFPHEEPDVARGPIHVVDSLDAMTRAAESWRAGAMPERPQVTLHIPTLTDPSLAPAGKAVMTATLAPIPAQLATGPWTQERRNILLQMALVAAERVSPGIAETVLAHEILIAPDIERLLGLTQGDLDGGELAPDQMLSFRPFPDWEPGRTPIPGLYLGGVSVAPSPFLTGVAGERAALALLHDLKEQARP